MLAATGRRSCWSFTGLGRQVWEVRSRLRCRRSCPDWPDNMALGLMATPTKSAFPETKTFTREASTKDPRCSYSAKPNPPRTRRKTSVLTSGTYGRKSGFEPVEHLRGKSLARDNLLPAAISVRYPPEPANPNHCEHHGVAEAGEKRTPGLTAPGSRTHGSR